MEEAFQNAQALEDYCAGVVAPYLDGVEKSAVPKDLGRSMRCGSLYELDLGWTKKTCRVGDLTARGAAAFHGAIYRLTAARAVLHCTDPYVVELSRRGENLRPCSTTWRRLQAAKSSLCRPARGGWRRR